MQKICAVILFIAIIGLCEGHPQKWSRPIPNSQTENVRERRQFPFGDWIPLNKPCPTCRPLVDPVDVGQKSENIGLTPPKPPTVTRQIHGDGNFFPQDDSAILSVPPPPPRLRITPSPNGNFQFQNFATFTNSIPGPTQQIFSQTPQIQFVSQPFLNNQNLLVNSNHQQVLPVLKNANAVFSQSSQGGQGFEKNPRVETNNFGQQKFSENVILDQNNRPIGPNPPIFQSKPSPFVKPQAFLTTGAQPPLVQGQPVVQQQGLLHQALVQQPRVPQTNHFRDSILTPPPVANFTAQNTVVPGREKEEIQLLYVPVETLRQRGNFQQQFISQQQQKQQVSNIPFQARPNIASRPSSTLNQGITTYHPTEPTTTTSHQPKGHFVTQNQGQTVKLSSSHPFTTAPTPATVFFQHVPTQSNPNAFASATPVPPATSTFPTPSPVAQKFTASVPETTLPHLSTVQNTIPYTYSEIQFGTTPKTFITEEGLREEIINGKPQFDEYENQKFQTNLKLQQQQQRQQPQSFIIQKQENDNQFNRNKLFYQQQNQEIQSNRNVNLQNQQELLLQKQRDQQKYLQQQKEQELREQYALKKEIEEQEKLNQQRQRELEEKKLQRQRELEEQRLLQEKKQKELEEQRLLQLQQEKEAEQERLLQEQQQRELEEQRRLQRLKEVEEKRLLLQRQRDQEEKRLLRYQQQQQKEREELRLLQQKQQKEAEEQRLLQQQKLDEKRLLQLQKQAELDEQNNRLLQEQKAEREKNENYKIQQQLYQIQQQQNFQSTKQSIPQTTVKPETHFIREPDNANLISQLEKETSDETSELIPHQPPLSVFYKISGKGEPRIVDVLKELRNSKTITVLDQYFDEMPKVFVGPAGLTSPSGYNKFELPYLSNIESEANNKKLDKLPFFVAPLNFVPPLGYSKIPFPSPHVGSVVVSSESNPAMKGNLPENSATVLSEDDSEPTSFPAVGPELPGLINSLETETTTAKPTTPSLPQTTAQLSNRRPGSSLYRPRKPISRTRVVSTTTTTSTTTTSKPSSYQGQKTNDNSGETNVRKPYNRFNLKRRRPQSKSTTESSVKSQTESKTFENRQDAAQSIQQKTLKSPSTKYGNFLAGKRQFVNQNIDRTSEIQNGYELPSSQKDEYKTQISGNLGGFKEQTFKNNNEKNNFQLYEDGPFPTGSAKSITHELYKPENYKFKKNQDFPENKDTLSVTLQPDTTLSPEKFFDESNQPKIFEKSSFYSTVEPKKVSQEKFDDVNGIRTTPLTNNNDGNKFSAPTVTPKYYESTQNTKTDSFQEASNEEISEEEQQTTEQVNFEDTYTAAFAEISKHHHIPRPLSSTRKHETKTSEIHPTLELSLDLEAPSTEDVPKTSQEFSKETNSLSQTNKFLSQPTPTQPSTNEFSFRQDLSKTSNFKSFANHGVVPTQELNSQKFGSSSFSTVLPTTQGFSNSQHRSSTVYETLRNQKVGPTVPGVINAKDVNSASFNVDKKSNPSSVSPLSNQELTSVNFETENEEIGSTFSGVNNNRKSPNSNFFNLNNQKRVNPTVQSSFNYERVNPTYYNIFNNEEVNPTLYSGFSSERGNSEVHSTISSEGVNPTVHSTFSSEKVNPTVHSTISSEGVNPTVHSTISSEGAIPTVQSTYSNERVNPTLYSTLSSEEVNPTVHSTFSSEKVNPTVFSTFNKKKVNPTVYTTSKNEEINPTVYTTSETEEINPTIYTTSKKEKINPTIYTASKNEEINPTVYNTFDNEEIDPTVLSTITSEKVNPTKQINLKNERVKSTTRNTFKSERVNSLSYDESNDKTISSTASGATEGQTNNFGNFGTVNGHGVNPTYFTVPDNQEFSSVAYEEINTKVNPTLAVTINQGTSSSNYENKNLKVNPTSPGTIQAFGTVSNENIKPTVPGEHRNHEISSTLFDENNQQINSRLPENYNDYKTDPTSYKKESEEENGSVTFGVRKQYETINPTVSGPISTAKTATSTSDNINNEYETENFVSTKTTLKSISEIQPEVELADTEDFHTKPASKVNFQTYKFPSRSRGQYTPNFERDVSSNTKEKETTFATNPSSKEVTEQGITNSFKPVKTDDLPTEDNNQGNDETQSYVTRPKLPATSGLRGRARIRNKSKNSFSYKDSRTSTISPSIRLSSESQNNEDTNQEYTTKSTKLPGNQRAKLPKYNNFRSGKKPIRPTTEATIEGEQKLNVYTVRPHKRLLNPSTVSTKRIRRPTSPAPIVETSTETLVTYKPETYSESYEPAFPASGVSNDVYYENTRISSLNRKLKKPYDTSEQKNDAILTVVPTSYPSTAPSYPTYVDPLSFVPTEEENDESFKNSKEQNDEDSKTSEEENGSGSKILENVPSESFQSSEISKPSEQIEYDSQSYSNGGSNSEIELPSNQDLYLTTVRSVSSLKPIDSEELKKFHDGKKAFDPDLEKKNGRRRVRVRVHKRPHENFETAESQNLRTVANILIPPTSTYKPFDINNYQSAKNSKYSIGENKFGVRSREYFQKHLNISVPIPNPPTEIKSETNQEVVSKYLRTDNEQFYGGSLENQETDTILDDVPKIYYRNGQEIFIPDLNDKPAGETSNGKRQRTKFRGYIRKLVKKPITRKEEDEKPVSIPQSFEPVIKETTEENLETYSSPKTTVIKNFDHGKRFNTTRQKPSLVRYTKKNKIKAQTEDALETEIIKTEQPEFHETTPAEIQKPEPVKDTPLSEVQFTQLTVVDHTKESEVPKTVPFVEVTTEQPTVQPEEKSETFQTKTVFATTDTLETHSTESLIQLPESNTEIFESNTEIPQTTKAADGEYLTKSIFATLEQAITKLYPVPSEAPKELIEEHSSEPLEVSSVKTSDEKFPYRPKSYQGIRPLFQRAQNSGYVRTKESISGNGQSFSEQQEKRSRLNRYKFGRYNSSDSNAKENSEDNKSYSGTRGSSISKSKTNNLDYRKYSRNKNREGGFTQFFRNRYSTSQKTESQSTEGEKTQSVNYQTLTASTEKLTTNEIKHESTTEILETSTEKELKTTQKFETDTTKLETSETETGTEFETDTTKLDTTETGTTDFKTGTTKLGTTETGTDLKTGTTKLETTETGTTEFKTGTTKLDTTEIGTEFKTDTTKLETTKSETGANFETATTKLETAKTETGTGFETDTTKLETTKSETGADFETATTRLETVKTETGTEFETTKELEWSTELENNEEYLTTSSPSTNNDVTKAISILTTLFDTTFPEKTSQSETETSTAITPESTETYNLETQPDLFRFAKGSFRFDETEKFTGTKNKDHVRNITAEIIENTSSFSAPGAEKQSDLFVSPIVSNENYKLSTEPSVEKTDNDDDETDKTENKTFELTSDESTTTNLETTDDSSNATKPVSQSKTSKQVKTSTTTKISHETEICYRGRCIRTKSENPDEELKKLVDSSATEIDKNNT